MKTKRFAILMTLLITANLLTSQQSDINYNKYYRYPLSIGAEYQSLSPFGEYSSEYNIFDISARVRFPLPPVPSIQLLLNAGMITFDNLDTGDPTKWDHNHWYGQLGASYTHRFDKSFEVGAELAGGASLALFNDLLPETGPVHTTNLIFEAGARVGLDPSYNFSIDVHPSLKYLYSLSGLKDFDGFVFGIGFSASYRFGTDPDAPAAVIRSLDIGKVTVPDLFASMQSYYVENSFGTIELTNREKHSLENLEVSFFQAGFMDTPTPVASYQSVEAGQRIEVPLIASFNRNVFDIEGIVPLTGEIIMTYTSGNKPAEQKASITYDLYDKTSMIWDDDRKVASFITPSDSAIRNYASFIRQSCRDSVIPAYSEPMQFAIQAFHALGEIGCLYQIDPTLPFTEVQDNIMVVDSISLPRNTLANITGDCDDLTVLYSSLLESVGVKTAFITVPGHIFSAFNTKIPARDFAKIHPDRKMSIVIDGELWIPVEITMIGESGFSDAWRKGAEQWHQYADAPEDRALYKTGESQQLYRPVGLTQTDMGLQYGNGENINRDFNREMDRIISFVTEEYAEKARETGRKQDYNKLGIVQAEFKRYELAEQTFKKVLSIDPDYKSAQINLGNILFLNKKYIGARILFEQIYSDLEKRNRGTGATALKLLINLAKTCYYQEDYDSSDLYLNKARSINEEEAEKYSYLATAVESTGSVRASAESSFENLMIFVEEE